MLFYLLHYIFVRYGALKSSQIIENLHNGFLRQIVGLKENTPIYMLHAELGRHPIQINIKSRSLPIVNEKNQLYTAMLKDEENLF